MNGMLYSWLQDDFKRFISLLYFMSIHYRIFKPVSSYADGSIVTQEHELDSDQICHGYVFPD